MENSGNTARKVPHESGINISVVYFISVAGSLSTYLLVLVSIVRRSDYYSLAAELFML